jgi:S1-C subfamily serine protease
MRLSQISLALSLFALPLYAQQSPPKAQRIAVVTRAPGSYLGVYCMDVDAEIAKSSNLKEERGVLVTKVDPGSPAQHSGLQEKDVILEYNSQRVEGTAHFIRLVSETPVGRKVTLGVSRNGAMQTLTAQIGARPAQNTHSFMLEPMTPTAPPMPPEPPDVMLTMPDIPSGLLGWQSSSLGYVSEPVDGQLADFFGVNSGVLVRSVIAKSPADRAGLKAGDVIIKADGTAVRSPREITGMLRRRGENRHLSLTVVRSHKEMTLDLIAKNSVDSDSQVL